MPSLREAEVYKLHLKLHRNRREKRCAGSPRVSSATHSSHYRDFDVFRCLILVYRGAAGSCFKAMFSRAFVSSLSRAVRRGIHCAFPLAGRCNPMRIRCRSCETENRDRSSFATPCVARCQSLNNWKQRFQFRFRVQHLVPFLSLISLSLQICPGTLYRETKEGASWSRSRLAGATPASGGTLRHLAAHPIYGFAGTEALQKL
jgi:hypothetical protein